MIFSQQVYFQDSYPADGTWYSFVMRQERGKYQLWKNCQIFLVFFLQAESEKWSFFRL